MKRNVLRKNVLQTIRRSLGRYIAIVAIIALGAGMFVGLLTTKSDMVATAQKYLDQQNMFDLRLLSSYGWSHEDVEKIASMEGIVDAEGAVTVDAFASLGETLDDTVFRFHGIPEKISRVYLLEGRMPEKPNECLIDGFHMDSSVIGQEFVVSAENDSDTLDSLTEYRFTVVGMINSPLYMDMGRGSTTLGGGSVTGFVYVQPEVFDLDYYTEISVTIAGDHQVYSEAFTKAMEDMAKRIEGDVTVIAEDRMIRLKAEGEKEYADGLAEYEKGLADYEQGKQEALAKLDDALRELEDGQAKWDENWAAVLDGEQQIADAEKTLAEGEQKLLDGKLELVQAKKTAYDQLSQAHSELMKNYKEVLSGLEQVEQGLAQLDAGIPQLEDGLTQIDQGIQQLDLLIGIQKTGIQLTQSLLETAKNMPEIQPEYIQTLEKQLEEQKVAYDESILQRQELVQMQAEYSDQLAQLKQTREELLETKATLTAAKNQIDMGFLELDNQQKQAENQFASAEAELEAGEVELELGRKELERKKQELADGRIELEDARLELEQGWADYEKGKAEAEAELADAETKLADAKLQLDDARKTLDEMNEVDVYILDRNTNQGYLAVDNNSDIVSGVSRVFPVFFLLVAALVCITTLTRMVEEERTQIGIFKALGYSNRQIINKYLVYTASAALIGCGFGVLAGSIVFPIILWEAYGIILCVMPQIVLQLNWPLCLAVVGAYTVVSMLATWYCCRSALREVPAELIRPKAPTAGKKIWLEYIPLWNKIGFLNKVMFRNVFRYRQRLLMMLMGICGCTALLLTGFGLRDSILNIVDDQFDNIMVYDMEVYFAEGQNADEQLQFRDQLKDKAQSIHYFHQSSMELEFDKQNTDIYMIVSDEEIRDYMHFYYGSREYDMPEAGEVYLSAGVVENFGIRIGDTVTLRDPNMRALTLKVSGIFENHVFNFAVLRPETVQQQWGTTPQQQMAFVLVNDGVNVGDTAAELSDMDTVLNVSVTEDLEERVTGMMKALDLVVITIVVCAGMLAVIVLYNLTNISITERIREIATIKVLGFNSKETAAYVFKENLLLTFMGTAVGLVGGIFLLRFVMSQIKVNFVWMQASFEPLSFLWAILLTALSALLVDFILYFKLEKINMAEALKSVE